MKRSLHIECTRHLFPSFNQKYRHYWHRAPQTSVCLALTRTSSSKCRYIPKGESGQWPSPEPHFSTERGIACLPCLRGTGCMNGRSHLLCPNPDKIARLVAQIKWPSRHSQRMLNDTVHLKINPTLASMIEKELSFAKYIQVASAIQIQ